MLPIMGLSGLLEAIGSGTAGISNTVTGSEVGVGDAILESMEEELGKVLKGKVVWSTLRYNK
jgi:hypothetical protein